MKPLFRLSRFLMAILCLLTWIVLTPSTVHADSFRFAVNFSAPPPPPPPPRVEVRWAPPTPQHCWVEGHWGHDNDRDGWVWHPGYYEYPPVPWAKWISAHGKRYEGGYFWVKGHWNY